MEATQPKGQLKKTGMLGGSDGWDLIGGSVVEERLRADGTDMLLTIGLAFRNPATLDKHLSNAEALEWFGKYGKKYTFEAEYTGDGYLHVTALGDNDLF